MSTLDPFLEAVQRRLPPVDADIVAALAPTGKLRAGINVSNFLLVTGQSSNAAPEGVSPSIAAALARFLGCKLELLTFESPGAVADAAEREAWDIGNIGADPARAAFIQFTDAYCEIEGTCLVKADAGIGSFTDVDRPGVKISTKKRAAYTLWLERHIQHADLIQFDSMDASAHAFADQDIDVLAGLRPRLMEDVQRLDGTVLLEDRFVAVQQAIGTPKNRNPKGAEFLQRFVEAATSEGLVQALIDQHGVTGKLTVATN